jgi:hypothetical protein
MMTLIWIIIAVLFSTTSLFLLFIFVVRLKKFVKDKPDWVRKVLLVTLFDKLFLAVLWDYVYQWTWASLLFWQWPEIRREADGKLHIEWLVTGRLTRHIEAGYIKDGWRWAEAVFWCCLIEKIERNHCHTED